MAERTTLADFARSIGISPATARQWKKRGKIVEVEGGFKLIAEAQREWLGLDRDIVVTPDPASRTPSVTAQPDDLRVNVTRGEFQALLARVETLEAENRELRQLWIDTESAVAELETARVGAASGKSNYTGSAASVGERFDDAPPGGIVW